MADRPILFSAPMIRALLAGTKTQTRRALKPQPVCHVGAVPSFSWGRYGGLYPDDWFGYGSEIDGALPYRPGDRLWVREAHALVPASAYRMSDGVQQAINPSDRYEAAVYRCDWERSAPPWRPSIHMPRWASRLTLTVTDVRVQRLQDISEEDAIAEGVATFSEGRTMRSISDAEIYRLLWEEINGAGSWDRNDWVAAYTFSVERRNIDAEARHDL